MVQFNSSMSTYKCKQCNAQFSSKDILNEHQKLHKAFKMDEAEKYPVSSEEQKHSHAQKPHLF